MTTPIDPQMCVRTGRLLTEWFEHPELTKEDVELQACEHFGIKPEDRPRGDPLKMAPEDADFMRRFNAYVAGKKARKWPYAMSKQEVAYRMNEATKMVDPTNFKFLPDETRERTGLEINPLWMMECLIRSGVLSAKEQVAALKELAQYTHSKAPSINHSTTTHLKPEDWLLELAKEEYQVLGDQIEMKQPMQPIERGAGKKYEKAMTKKAAEIQSLINFGSSEMADMEALVDAEWEDVTDDDS